jgi:predicted acylesterase/phospholipase RssA
VFVVAAQKREGRLGPYIFRSYESSEQEASTYYTGSTNGRGITLAQALLATSAAPGYLPPIRIGTPSVWPCMLLSFWGTKSGPSLWAPTQTGEHEFIDGGVVANNPTEIAILEALRLWPGRRLSVVSLGTGFPTMDPQPPNGAGSSRSSASLSPLPAIHKSVEPLFDIIAAATDAEQIHRRTKDWLDRNRKLASCVRLNPPCPAFDLAACKEEQLDHMLSETRAYLERGSFLREVIDLLNKA